MKFFNRAKTSQFHFCFGSQGYILKLIANHQYCLESSSLKSYKTTVFSHVNVLSRIANGSHCVFLRGFFLNDPITKFSFEFFFYYRIHYELLNRKRGKKQQLVTGGSKRLLTLWAFFPSTLMMFLTVFITLIINACYVCCKYMTMFHFIYRAYMRTIFFVRWWMYVVPIAPLVALSQF